MGEGMEVVGVLLPLFALLLGAGGVAYVGFIVLQALRRKLLGADWVDPAELMEMRERLAELEESGVGRDPHEEQRLTELEERLDFAERLLSQQEPAALPEASGDTTAQN